MSSEEEKELQIGLLKDTEGVPTLSRPSGQNLIANGMNRFFFYPQIQPEGELSQNS